MTVSWPVTDRYHLPPELEQEADTGRKAAGPEPAPGDLHIWGQLSLSSGDMGLPLGSGADNPSLLEAPLLRIPASLSS